MEAVSDIGFRSLCASNGAALVWTEMVRAQSVARKNASTLSLIDTYDAKNINVGVQLFTKSAVELTEALNRIEELSNDPQYDHFKNIVAIDLNFGCPSSDVIRIGCGPALLKRRKKLEEIFGALVKWKESTSLSVKAVGCKIRLGLNEMEQSHKVYLRVADAANTAGLDFVTVHARNAQQKSSDLPSWAAIGEFKDKANMPIFGNGNVFSYEDAVQLQAQSNCDGVMLARAG